MLYSLLLIGVFMEAVMIAGVAALAVSGWYSAVDMFADIGIQIRKQKNADMTSRKLSRSCPNPLQRRVKQMAGVDI